MMRNVIVAVALLGSAAAANAATQCYRASEIEADQAVRYQTSLMVLSDSCGGNIYTDFIRRNGDLLARYQRQLIAFFSRTKGRHGSDAFDQFMTQLANKTSLDVGARPLASVCGDAGDFLAQAAKFVADDFKRFIAAQAVARRNDYPNCPG